MARSFPRAGTQIGEGSASWISSIRANRSFQTSSPV